MLDNNNSLGLRCFRVIISRHRLRWQLQWISILTKTLYRKLEEKPFTHLQAVTFQSRISFKRRIKWILRWVLVTRQLSHTSLKSRSKSLTKSTLSVFLRSRATFLTVSSLISSNLLKKTNKRRRLANLFKCLLDKA
jgi:hypothetical protein